MQCLGFQLKAGQNVGRVSVTRRSEPYYVRLLSGYASANPTYTKALNLIMSRLKLEAQCFKRNCTFPDAVIM